MGLARRPAIALPHHESGRKGTTLKISSLDSWLAQPPAVLPPSLADAGNMRSRRLELRRSGFDMSSDRDWCELVRDAVAVANSGGGTITIACSPDDLPSDPSCPRTLDLAASDVVHRLTRYTDSSFADVSVRALERRAVEIEVGPAVVPIAFTRAGTCSDPQNPARIHEVFAAGTFYFLHNGASEPGTTSDMRSVLERNVRRVRKRWLRGIRRVMSQPIEKLARRKWRRDRAPSRTDPPASLQPVRIVTDPNAPALQPQDVDRLFPWRQKDLVRELNARLGQRALNSYDIQAVRRQHHLDERPDFIFHLEGAGRRYSQVVVEWIMDQYTRDHAFFRQARSADHEMRQSRRRTPRGSSRSADPGGKC